MKHGSKMNELEFHREYQKIIKEFTKETQYSINAFELVKKADCLVKEYQQTHILKETTLKTPKYPFMCSLIDF